jgi:RNA polymerase sigma factor (sigma-70 family)
MLNRQQKVILPHLSRLIGSPSGGDLSDGDLLERFLRLRDAAAFAELVRRHGPSVLGVCRRVLHNSHDAEDAFQATFLVLARKARSISRRESLGSWLYGVAYRVALKARAEAARRRKHERRAAHGIEDQSGREAARDELWPILDEEVNRLPDKYRQPVVLCYFQGKTYQEAARLLGWPAGTASVRLARARELLRSRLSRRGLALSSCALAVCLAEATASTAEACLLAGATAGAAALWLADPAAAGVSNHVIALTEGVVKAMLLRKLKVLAGISLVVAMTLGGAGAFRRGAATAPAAAAAADRPGAARADDTGRSGGDRLIAAGRPSPPAEAAPAPFAADEPLRQAGAPLGAPPRALAPPAGDGDRPPQSRIGLINMARVLKGSRKIQALQADLRARTQEAQQKLDVLKKQVQQYQADCDQPTTPLGMREQLAQKVRQLRREIEDESERARARMTRANGDVLTAAYREVEEVANRIAKAKGIELVLFYSDAVTQEDFYNPDSLQRKLSHPGALVPMMVAPGMDITEAVTEALNRAYAPSGSPGQ